VSAAGARRHLALDRAAFVELLRHDATRAEWAPGRGGRGPGPRLGQVTAVLGDGHAANAFATELARPHAHGARHALLVASRLDGVAAAGRARAVELLRLLARSRPVVVTTSSAAVAALVDRVIVLDGTSPIADGPPPAVLGTAALLSDASARSRPASTWWSSRRRPPARSPRR